jgi:hypothetical protein
MFLNLACHIQGRARFGKYVIVGEMCLFPFHAFSYFSYLHCGPSPIVINFITCLILQHLCSFRAFSNYAYLHSAHYPTALIVTIWMWLWEDKRRPVLLPSWILFVLLYPNREASITNSNLCNKWIWGWGCSFQGGLAKVGPSCLHTCLRNFKMDRTRE